MQSVTTETKLKNEMMTACEAIIRPIAQAMILSPREEKVLRQVLCPGDRSASELIDLDAMPPQERLGVLCRAAERIGVMK